MPNRVYIGSDHAGFRLKSLLLPYLEELGVPAEDLGAHELNPDDDYPAFSRAVAEAVASHDGSFGIVIGGSGQGEAMVANRIPGVRAAVFYGEVPAQGVIELEGTEPVGVFDIVRLPRMHNDANVLSLAARFVSDAEAKEAVRLFLATPFSGSARHERRIKEF